MEQLLLGVPNTGAPAGFDSRQAMLGVDEEAALIRDLAGLPFEAFAFRGFLGRRRVVSFGWRYDFERAALLRGPEMPGFLEPLRARAEVFAGLPEGAFEHGSVTEYAPGVPIGWHRDRPAFGVVVGLSLASECVLRFRRKSGHAWERWSWRATPRSAYKLSGEARTEWEHSIAPVEALRYSITFRTLARRSAGTEVVDAAGIEPATLRV